MKKEIIGLLLVVLIGSCGGPKTQVDQIVVADKIYICNSSFDVAEAMAISQGKIVATGSKKEISRLYTSDSVSTIKGIIYPGFIDAHSHFYGYGLTLNKVDLRNTISMNDMAEKTVAFAQQSKDYWITGRGWDQTIWEQQGTLTNNLLNAYFPDRPVFIKRVDGHAGLANNKALELAGINTNTQVEGGEITNMGGLLTGLLTDNAMELVDKIIPTPSKESEIDALLKAQKNCFAAGLTTVTDAGLDLATILLIDSLQRTGDLTIRVYAMCNPTEANFDYFATNGAILNDKLRVNSFKLYADGSLGSRGAKLKQSYCDHEGHTGVWVTRPEELENLYQLVYDLGFQANTHCIGDSANRKVLELYGNILKGENDKRWRIEHAQVVTPSDRKLFSKYSIIPSVQPTHATSDMRWASNRLCNSRLSGAYSYKSLLALNGWLPLGTDFPVEDIAPLNTFFAAVYRQDAKNNPVGGFLLEEALTASEALLGMTYWAAKGNKMEELVGSLEKGKQADYIILNKDITADKYMLNTFILATYIDAKKVK